MLGCKCAQGDLLHLARLHANYPSHVVLHTRSKQDLAPFALSGAFDIPGSLNDSWHVRTRDYAS